MQIERLYNKVAKTYNQDISGKVLDEAKQRAVDLVLTQNRSFNSILALGMGDGTDILPYTEHYPNANLQGLDISEKMLERAKELLKCITYHGDITKASTIIKKRDFDFILAHFVSAYVPLPLILAECRKLIAGGGLISIVTNTMDSFPVAQSLLPVLEESPNPFNKLVAYHIKKTLKKVYVPQDLNHLQNMIEASGFKLKTLEEKKIQISLKTEKDVFDFFIHGGWFVSGFMHPLLPHKLMSRVCQQLIHKNFSMPYEDSMKIAFAIVE
ncbi:class I SAM-dependent DNA methyltransferase [Legionella tunisiensis]|uniref:class I SAM-dependent DNA methyltransferase n=1 Tax=Legionella tunisiensis TaxID=1034944 RepID=UPI0002FF2666|nr:class I SAM-dependent methyltransferase [Legionella tunisiensis]